jgi:hypothetical protein
MQAQHSNLRVLHHPEIVHSKSLAAEASDFEEDTRMNMHYVAEYICRSRFMCCLLFISQAVFKTWGKVQSGCAIYSFAKGHDIDIFVSDTEPNLQIYQESM